MTVSNLKDLPCIEFWLKKAAHSDNTRISYLSNFSRFLQATHLDAEPIQAEWQKVRYDYREREMFLDRQSELIEKFYYSELENLAPKTKATILAAILSFYQHSKIPVEVDITTELYITNHNRAIKREEIKRILDNATLRDRTFFLMMLESGLRPDTLTKLRYRHIKEEFEAAKVPMMIKLEATMIKDHVGTRFSFIGEEGYKALKEYLAPRLTEPEPDKPTKDATKKAPWQKIQDDDVIFRAVHTKQQTGASLSPALFSVQFGEIVKKLNLAEMREGRKRRELNLYSLRKWFRNHIKVSDPAFREFWMGHSLGTDAHYFEAAQNWKNWMTDPEVVERHRAEYAKAYPSLRIHEEQDNADVMKVLKERNEEIAALKESMKELEPVLAFVKSFKANKDLELFIRTTMETERIVKQKKEPKEPDLSLQDQTKFESLADDLSISLAKMFKKLLTE